jgi:proline racemase
MRWSRTIQTVDVHCAGEIGRVITGGVLNIPGATMAEKLHHLNTVDDSLRRWLCSEPRSAPAGSFCLLTPACDPRADVGFIVLQPDQAHAMSGSNAMCAATALLETGMIPMAEPESRVVFDTAAGLVTATAACAGGKVVRVTLDMPPAFVARLGAGIDTPEWGRVSYDLCFGGVFYALVDAAQVGLAIAPENARQLAMIGVDLRNRIAAQEPALHPTTPALNGLAYVMFRSDEPDGAHLHHLAAGTRGPVALRHRVELEHGGAPRPGAGQAGRRGHLAVDHRRRVPDHLHRGNARRPLSRHAQPGIGAVLDLRVQPDRAGPVRSVPAGLHFVRHLGRGQPGLTRGSQALHGGGPR